MSDVRRYEVTFYRYKRQKGEGHFGLEMLGEFVDARTCPCDAYSAQDAMFQVELQARGSAHVHRVVRVETAPADGRREHEKVLDPRPDTAAG